MKCQNPARNDKKAWPAILGPARLCPSVARQATLPHRQHGKLVIWGRLLPANEGSNQSGVKKLQRKLGGGALKARDVSSRTGIPNDAHIRIDHFETRNEMPCRPGNATMRSVLTGSILICASFGIPVRDDTSRALARRRRAYAAALHARWFEPRSPQHRPQIQVFPCCLCGSVSLAVPRFGRAWQARVLRATLFVVSCWVLAFHAMTHIWLGRSRAAPQWSMGGASAERDGGRCGL